MKPLLPKFDKSKLTPKIVDAYRKPQLVRGWEWGLVNFTASRISGRLSLRKILSDAWKGRVKPMQAELLADAVAKHNIKVLIVHGKYDRLIPASNSERLARLLPGSKLVIMDRTGHVPHEEHPEEFLRLTHEFLANPI